MMIDDDDDNSKPTDGTVDHNVLRHLRIEKDSEYYKKLENINKGFSLYIKIYIITIIIITTNIFTVTIYYIFYHRYHQHHRCSHYHHHHSTFIIVAIITPSLLMN